MPYVRIDARGADTGVPQIPMETLYKKNVLLTRGRFRPFTTLHNDMLMGAAAQFFCTSGDSEVRSTRCLPTCTSYLRTLYKCTSCT